jgi:uncharacterized NAD-dependent epimerase/dehydratase family protein
VKSQTTKKRRYAILAPECFASRSAKTAHGVIAYGHDEVVAVVDPQHAGRTVRDVVSYLDSDAPIVSSVADALTYKPNALLVGTAPPGGALPAAWRDEILMALTSGLEVVSGLHEILADDGDFAEAAWRSDAAIWDVRIPTATPLFSGKAWTVKPYVLLTVGSDCAVGKMTVSLELVRAAAEKGRLPEFIATGQTGIMIAGRGIAVDHVLSDFATGAVESMVTAHGSATDLLVVEGQGGINHPAYAPVTLSLMFGAAPDGLVLVHDLARKVVEGYGTPILSYRTLIRSYEALLASVKPARVLGIALNTSSLNEEDAVAAIAAARAETGLPVDDLVRFGPGSFYDAIAPQLSEKTLPVRE